MSCGGMSLRSFGTSALRTETSKLMFMGEDEMGVAKDGAATLSSDCGEVTVDGGAGGL